MDDFSPDDHWILIGQGASADVWALDDKHVIKLFRVDVNQVPVNLEFAAGLWAEAQGIPVARVIKLMQIGDRSGILFGRIDGPDMLSVILHRPFQMWRLIKQLAQLQAQVHRSPGGEMLPRQTDVLRHRILRSKAQEQAIATSLKILDRLPGRSQFVHGDLHPANLLLSSSGIVIIDWAQAASGTPAADAARTELLLRFGAADGTSISALVGAITARWYRRCYAQFSGLSYAELDPWRLPVAVAWHRGQLGAAEARLTRWICRLTKRAMALDVVKG